MFSTYRLCSRCLSRPHRRPLRFQRRPHSTQSTGDDFSPALLSRARLLAGEHTNILNQLADQYDAKAAKRLGELSSTTNALHEFETARASLKELHSLLRSPDEELQQLAEDDVEPTRQRILQASETLKSSLIPAHPFAHLPCLIEIRPGAGGDEAALFAGDLLRMYEIFCANNSLDTTLLSSEEKQDGTGGSSRTHILEAVLEVKTSGAYGLLRCEAGVHRVQRVPATETKGRTHTSAASVLVLPSIQPEGSQDLGEDSFNDPKSDYYLPVDEVRMDVMRASGAGGQHVNKTESAVRLTHVPTNTVVTMQETRSQVRNRERAWQILRSKIAQARREERELEIVRMRRGAGAGKVGRENKVRTYNYGQQRVSDHRSGFDVRNLVEVMEGGQALEKVMDSVRAWMADQEMLTLLAEEQNA